MAFVPTLCNANRDTAGRELLFRDTRPGHFEIAVEQLLSPFPFEAEVAGCKLRTNHTCTGAVRRPPFMNTELPSKLSMTMP